jgi:uncharacterized Zn-finger protein
MAAVSMMAFPPRDNFTGYPQQYAAYQARTQVPLDHQAFINNSAYSGHVQAAQSRQQPQVPSRASDNSASSTLEDGSRPSLPSISNLLDIADGDRPSSDNGQYLPIPANAKTDRFADSRSSLQSTAQEQSRHLQGGVDDTKSRHSYSSRDSSNPQRSAVPPTPPLRNDSVVEHTQSPSTISTGSSLSAQPYFMGSALNNVEADHQRAAHINLLKRQSIPSQPNGSPYNTSPYANSPGGLSSGSYCSPSDPAYANGMSGLYQQRPLPSNFPPPPAGPVHSTSAAPAPTNNPWEHHHYISPSSQATFPQSQDRYICQTCNKAFSRPSSLKIHSHSHTGEKPFKCPHAGCGKAFSVRSNMKRHERGCHTGANGMVSTPI